MTAVWGGRCRRATADYMGNDFSLPVAFDTGHAAVTQADHVHVHRHGGVQICHLQLLSTTKLELLSAVPPQITHICEEHGADIHITACMQFHHPTWSASKKACSSSLFRGLGQCADR